VGRTGLTWVIRGRGRSGGTCCEENNNDNIIKNPLSSRIIDTEER
jgi:hypothetical protein